MYLHKLKQLLRRAMLDADAGTRDQLLLHQFVGGLLTHISKQPRTTGEINDLDRVIEWVKLLQYFSPLKSHREQLLPSGQK